ncbi:Trm112 family protein [Rhodobacteraceae bacterium NNCM2]|nr:Trm112 family protein [Coraliihabitans acroporae]
MNDRQSDENPEWVSGKLIEVLTCPASGGKLEYDRERAELVSKRAALAYPIRSGIPIMLVDEARQIDR